MGNYRKLNFLTIKYWVVKQFLHKKKQNLTLNFDTTTQQDRTKTNMTSPLIMESQDKTIHRIHRKTAVSRY
jgi:hypothetical protein